MNLKAVIFDMDGVLLNSEPLHLEASCLLLKKLGVNIDCLNVTAGDIGADYETMWREFAKRYGIKKDIKSLVREQFQCTYDYFRTLDLREMEGLTDFIKDLKNNGVMCAVASASPVKVIELVLDKLDIAEYIQSFCGAEMVTEQKPSPEIYSVIVKRLGVDVSKCAVVEDSPIGVKAAKTAGMKCVAFNSARIPEEKLSQADLIINEFAQISYRKLLEHLKTL